MLDNIETVAAAKPKVTMSRKRTRSKSEENIFSTVGRIQPINMSFCDAAPYSEEPLPRQKLAECDYSVKITVEMAENDAAPRPVRVYADGAFDLFHQGHMRQLRQAKNMFPNIHLIAGVCSDRTLHNMKGRTVLTEEERYTSVRHCRYVDEVLRDAPWEYSDDFLTKYKIDFVAHDSIPYPTDDCHDIYGDLKKRGMFLATERTEGVSTSDIVARIVRDYDIYVRRNLARGYSAKELNISYLNEKKIRFQNRMHALKDKGKKVIDTLGERKHGMITKWEEKSKEFIENFMLMFRKNKLASIWNESRDKLMKAITPPHSPAPSSSEEEEDDEEEVEEEDDGYRPPTRRMRIAH